MLTLEACKALKAMGFDQRVPSMVWHGRKASPNHYDWALEPRFTVPRADNNQEAQWYACPDSIDALDWLAAQFGGTWQRDTDYWFSAPRQFIRRADTPSALIVAVAQVLG